MPARLRGLLAEQAFDAIHADQLWMAPYALAARDQAARAGAAPQTVLDQHNAVYLIPQRLAGAAAPYLRPAWRWEAARLRAYERATCLAFDQVVTLTGEDQAALLRLYAAGRRPHFAAVVPIGTDVSAPAGLPDVTASPPGVLFLGGMHWPPNAAGAQWLAREIWPQVRPAVPAAAFWAVGRNPPAALAAEAGVHAPGFVADPEPYWARARAFVVPLGAGGGMRVKILDAWAHGRPVVATTIGAEGLAYRDGEDPLIADEPAAFAAAVVRVLSDDDLARRLAAGGRATLARHYDWQTIYAAWDTIYLPGPGGNGHTTAQRAAAAA